MGPIRDPDVPYLQPVTTATLRDIQWNTKQDRSAAGNNDHVACPGERPLAVAFTEHDSQKTTGRMRHIPNYNSLIQLLPTVLPTSYNLRTIRQAYGEPNNYFFLCQRWNSRSSQAYTMRNYINDVPFIKSRECGNKNLE